jgi:tetratricopeptide (TPR) repeat protein
VWKVVFSPDGSRLASAGEDGAVKIWDTNTFQEALTLKAHAGGVKCVAFSSDGRRLASAGMDNTVKVWDARPLTADVRLERQALVLVEGLLARPLRKHEAVASLQADPAVRAEVRVKALLLVESYRDDPRRFADASWAVVSKPGAGPQRYRQALTWAEIACRLDPENGLWLRTLGVAEYRIGRYPAALEALSRAEPLNTARFQSPQPVDLAFLALTQHQLGQSDRARASLSRLRETLRQPRWAQDEAAQAFLREAVDRIEARPSGPRE